MIENSVNVDLDVFRRYAGLSLPRHVSYPMPSWWHSVDAGDVASMIAARNESQPVRDLSLYIHVPFCEALCKFCACHREVQRKDREGNAALTETYVAAMVREIRMLASRFGGGRSLRQVHWGGGTPTYLSESQVTRIHRAMEDAFRVADDAEISMEIDPRVTTRSMLETLRGLGFNRISMGVQDFDEQVQQHVRRVQPYDMVEESVSDCRELGFDAVNFDLIYGMPYQTLETISRTVEDTITLSPDRIAYYHYAQIPEKIATQRGMDYTRLPDSDAKFEMFLTGLDLFTKAGYEFIGLDHFARPDEGLAKASDAGTLQRNFQGMTTGGGLDMLGVGASSIGQLLGVGFLQNIKETDAYVACIERGDSPIVRGKRFTTDDRIRQAVLNLLYCHAEVRPALIEEMFGIRFAEYFAREIEILKTLERDGLIASKGDGAFEVTCPLGRVLMRNVAAVFDAYLDPEAYRLGEDAKFSANA